MEECYLIYAKDGNIFMARLARESREESDTSGH